MTRDERQKKYDDVHCIRMSLKLNLDTDKDIISRLDMSHKQRSIKQLIRKGLRTEQKEG